jgi:dTDP-4-amino-4,6-dideoxygalactose transaminase
MHRRRYCFFVTRGTTALYLTLKALGLRKGKVILPSNLCLSPANAVIYTGLIPIYCDINLDDFNLSIDNLERILKTEREIRALILPHIYGHPTDIDRVISLTEKYKVKLIEDAAQSLGGKYKGRPLGSFGEFSILSFGHAKILDVGGGGAILFDNKEYLKSIKYYLNQLPPKVRNYESLRRKYLSTYYTLASLVRRDYTLASLYYTFPYIFKNLFLFNHFDSNIINKIYTSLDDLERNVSQRNENAHYYRLYLNHEKIQHPKYKWEGVYWRYSFLIKNNHQQEITNEIRKKKIHISNWYPPIHLFYDIYPKSLKNAEYLGKHIFNLWVELSCSKRSIKKAIDVILKILDKYG